MERTAFLARVRDRLKEVGASPPLPTAFPATPASGSDASAERFLAALRAVAGDGEVVEGSSLTDAIGRVAARVASLPADRRSAVVAPDATAFAIDIDTACAAAGLQVVRPSAGAEWRDRAAVAGLGITSAVLGVASTGSVLIASGADSPRAASILPEHHLVIMPADRMVPGLEEAIDAVASLAATCSNPFLVTGPSRTSDIEMEMVLGAHGPRSVHVLLVR